jgi:hypothetical protein
MIYSHKSKKMDARGYTLLFAVLVSALVLGVGVSILNIARKELLLNSSARESQYAFYAADTGYECAVYNDLGVPSSAFSTSSPAASVQCGTASGVTPLFTSASTMAGPGGTTGKAYVFTFYIPIAGKACTIVQVTKDYKFVNASVGTVDTTQISSRGYNNSWNSTTHDCTNTNPTTVERALLINY